jgi:Protein of unknown function (DUF3149)
LRCDNHGGAIRALNRSIATPREISMQVVKELFASNAGIMSAVGIAFMLGMGVFFIRYFLKHMREDGERAARLER